MLYGKLEWFDKNINEMPVLKEEVTNKKEIPAFIKLILEYIRNIKFDEKPDYDYLIKLLVDVFNNNNYKLDNHFEWS